MNDEKNPLRDPIVDEVRRVRLTIDREHGSSFEGYTAHLRQIQKQYSDRIVVRQAGPGPGTPKAR